MKEGRGKEVWIISASVDLTIRRWRLADLVAPVKPLQDQKAVAPVAPPVPEPTTTEAGGGLTEEEERELAELMDED